MSGTALTLAALVAATVTSGLLAGVYLLYAHTVMPGLGRLDDQAFVAAFQALDRAIVNPWFMALGFLGTPVLTALALARTWGEPAAAWVATALVLTVAAMAVTARVHLPATTPSRRPATPATCRPPTSLRPARASTRRAGCAGTWCVSSPRSPRPAASPGRSCSPGAPPAEPPGPGRVSRGSASRGW